MKRVISALLLFLLLFPALVSAAAPELFVDAYVDETLPGEPIQIVVTGETKPLADVTVNGKKVRTNINGDFKYVQTVTSATYTKYDFEVKSQYFDDVSTVTKSVYVDFPEPELSLENAGITTLRYANGSYYIWFDYYDPLDSKPMLYVNGQKTKYLLGGKILEGGQAATFPVNHLREGANEFKFKIVNRYGVESEELTKIVYYAPKP
jgi:hypothetical protein